MSSRKLIFLLFSFFLFGFSIFGSTIAENISFHFPYFNLRNLTLLGDSYLRNGVIGLTQELGVPVSSSGSVIFNSPVTFFDPNTNLSASFSTRFSFSITNINMGSYGDGLTFFISPDNQTLGSSGMYLGLVNSSQSTKNKFVAVEFDTRLDSQFGDPNDNHIGLDIESLFSIKTEDVSPRGIDLKSGNLITAWIEYNNDDKMLNVSVSYSSFKPQKPILSMKIDLSIYFKKSMYIGFSASTEGSTELHLIADWTFQTSGFYRVKPWDVSDNSVPVIPATHVPDSDSHDDDNNNDRKKLGLGLGIAGPGFLCILVVFGWISVKKCRETGTHEILTPEFLSSPRQFSYMEIKSATRGFHPSRIVGHGAFGTVYKAIFPQSGSTFAVKRTKHTQESKSEFLAELSIIACLRHKNLVQLQGWCTEKGELLLVYEFMWNGSLDNVLYQEVLPEERTWLRWPMRYNIAVGIASVLSYLHQECEQQVIHRDVKTSNIMLDGNFNPRLGDFGLARLMEHNKSPVSTLTAGTMGYLAPEYVQYGKATEKTDVFSFGVVLLEVGCGKRPIHEKDGTDSSSNNNNNKMVNLVDWVWGLHSEGKIIEAADKRLNGEFVEEEMIKLLVVGLSCVNPDCEDRPSMRRVLQILNNEAEVVAIPRRKPTLTFSSGLGLGLGLPFSSLEDSVSSECEIV